MSVKSYRQVPQPGAASEPDALVGMATGAARVSTIQVHRISFWLLLIFCGILSITVINLLFFANQGARYTRADGDREEAARISADLVERKERQEGDRLCMERIGAVEKVIAGMTTEERTR